VNQVAETIGTILGKPVRKRHHPPRAGDIRDSWADLGKAERLLGYRPQIDLEEGLRRTVDFLRG
jgi:nucleoside-diphosphate-sugar epimerase